MERNLIDTPEDQEAIRTRLVEGDRTRQEIIQALLELPGRIRQAEVDLARAQEQAGQAKDRLNDREALILLGAVPGVELTGANEKQRAAQIRAATTDERLAVDQTAAAVSALAVYLRYEQNRFSAFKALARLLGGSE